MPIEDDTMIKGILVAAKTIAVIGASSKPYRDSNHIAEYLKQQGYKVIPVNPNYSEIDGEKCYPSLTSIDKDVDLVDIFRRSDAVDDVVDEAVKLKIKTIWFQLGVINIAAAQKAEQGGVQVVMNHCIAVDHSRLIR